MAEPAREEAARWFGAVAKVYDRARATYPPGVVR